MTARPKVCVVATTRLGIHFFLRPHLKQLAGEAEVVLALNPANDAYAPALNLPVREVAIAIKRPIAPRHDVAALIQLWRLFGRERPDLVLGVAPKAGLLGMVAAWMRRVPVRVFIFQGEVWASARGLKRKILKLADRITAACATHLLAVSAGERDFLEAEGVVRQGRIGVLGAGSIGGVDLDRFRPDSTAREAVRQALSIPAEAMLVLFVGRLNADKGVFELARAFRQAAAENPGLWLLWVGPDEANVAAALDEALGPAVARSRRVDFTETPERYMAAADAVCLPSHREGFGMVILEAAAIGLPAIGSRIYGISDAIQEGRTGLLFPVGDSQALAAALGRLVRDGALRQRLAEAARARAVADFDQRRVVAGYVDYLMGLLGRR